MGFTDKFLKSLTDLFLGLHWIAAFYAVMEPMILICPHLILLMYYVVVFLLALLLLLAPAGPLSLVLFDLFGLMFPSNFAIKAHLLLALGVAIGIVILKFFIYSAIKENRVLGVPAAWILTAYTATVSFVLASVLLTFSPPPAATIATVRVGMLRLLPSVLFYTVPMDLVVFSYIKFRDAIHRAESGRWIPTLAALWTAMLWPMPATIILLRARSPGFWNPFTVILMSARAAITALQLSYIALFVCSRDATLLK